MVHVRHASLVLITAAATLAVAPSTPAAAAAAAAAATSCATGNGLGAQTLVPATAVANGRFGSSTVTADFNGDGYTDAAISHHGNGRGSVDVYHGSPAGLALQTTLTPSGSVTATAQFGAPLTTGDFNGDGKDDLAVGVPGHNNDAGQVQSFTGAADGLSGTRVQVITQEFASDSSEAGDRFGSTLAAGDFDGDGKDDLAIAADEEAPKGSTVKSGEVTVVRGSATGLLRAWIITQAGLGQTAKAGDEFGISLIAGQVVGDARDDLIVGARGKDIGSDVDTGAIFILNGAGNKTTSNPIFRGQGGSADESGDKFGSAAAIGDFNADGNPDVAVGVPFEGGTGTAKRGVVEVFAGPVTKDSAGYFLGPTDQNDQTANNDLFGANLTARDLDNDGATDLVAGAVYTPRSGATRVGAASLFAGNRSGNLRPERTLVPADVGGTDQANAGFGANVAIGDFRKDGRLDAIIGSHGQVRNGATAAGVAYLVDDLSPATGRTVEQYAPTAALQSAPVGTATAPIRYAYTDNVGGPRILTQTDPQITSAVQRVVDGPAEARLTGRPVVGQTSDGKGVVGFRSVLGDLWMRSETTAGQTIWGPWVNHGGPDLSGIAMVSLSSGRLAVFGISSGGELVVREQLANDSFAAWRGTGLDNLTGDPVAVAVPGGIRLFARDLDGNLRTVLWNGSAATGCVTVGDRTIIGSPAITVRPGSQLQLFATTPDQQLVTIGQDPTGAFEASWVVAQESGVTGAPAAVFDRVTAKTTVMARTTDRFIWGATETLQGSGTYGEWKVMSGSESFTEVTAVPFTAGGVDSYYFVYHDVDNRELIMTPSSPSLRSAATFSERRLPKS